MTNATGRDVSDFQPVQFAADWAHDNFGIVKATEGTGWTGQTFPANWANLEAAVMRREDFPLRGAYHFLHPGQDPVAQAQHFMTVVGDSGLRPGDMLACDSELLAGAALAAPDASPEDAPARGAMLARAHIAVAEADLAATPDQVDAATLEFCDEVARLAGPRHPVVVYTMHEVGQHLHRTAAKYPLWFAWPSPTPPPDGMIAPWRSWLFWQDSFSSPRGGDGDQFDGTLAQLRAWVTRFQGPHRHIAAGESLDEIAASRHTTGLHLLKTSIAEYTQADVDALLAAPLHGVPYYTTNP